MNVEFLVLFLMALAAAVLFLFSAVYAWLRATRRLVEAPQGEAVVMGQGRAAPQPEHQYADIISRFLGLTPGNRVLTLRTGGGRGIQLVLDSMHPLTLRLEGSWSAEEEAKAGALMRAAVDSPPGLARLLDLEDAVQGVVFTSENQYSASDLIYRLITEVLAADPAGLLIDRDYEDHDARPAIVTFLEEQGCAEILHLESGVRVLVRLRYVLAAASTPGEGHQGGYRLEVPTATLDPRSGQQHRARQAINEAGWRHYEGETGPAPELEGVVEDPTNTWGYSVDHGDAKKAADAALRLLSTIAEVPIDVRVKVLPLAQGGR